MKDPKVLGETVRAIGVNHRNITANAARKFEEKLGKPPLWFDKPHFPGSEDLEYILQEAAQMSPEHLQELKDYVNLMKARIERSRSD